MSGVAVAVDVTVEIFDETQYASGAARFPVHLQDQDLSVWSLPLFSPQSTDMHIKLTGECKLGCASCDRV